MLHVVCGRSVLRLRCRAFASLVCRPEGRRRVLDCYVGPALDRRGVKASFALLSQCRRSSQSRERKSKGVEAPVDEKREEIRENVLTIPNVLCLTRIALSPVLAFLVLGHSYDLALGLFAFAGVTDLLDGFIARRFEGQQSMLGSFLDPMADKLLVFSLFLSLTSMDLIPVPLTILIVARDLCLVGAGFYIRYLSLPPPKTIGRYFDLTHATAKLTPSMISKINTATQLLLAATTLAAPVFHYVAHPALHMLWYLTASTTIASGLGYILHYNNYKLLWTLKSHKQ